MTTIFADIGDDNIYDLDANVAINAANDKIWFTAKHSFDDLDSAAVVRLGLNVATLSGIVVTDAPNGKFQVQIPEAALSAQVVEALVYDCQLKPQATGKVTTVQEGIMRLRKAVTKSTS